MSPSSRTCIDELIDILREARRLVALPANDFTRSSWEGAGDALRELDEVLDLLARGEVPHGTLSVLFAPTGPIQEVSLSSGWRDAFLALADRFDLAVVDG